MAGNPPPLPAGASTATKVLFTIAALFFIGAPVALPYSATLSAILGSVGGLALAAGAVVHTYWDHSP